MSRLIRGANERSTIVVSHRDPALTAHIARSLAEAGDVIITLPTDEAIEPQGSEPLTLALDNVHERYPTLNRKSRRAAASKRAGAPSKTSKEIARQVRRK